MDIERVSIRWEYICEVAAYVSGLGGPNTEGVRCDIGFLLNGKAAAGWELALITPLPFAATVSGRSGMGLSSQAREFPVTLRRARKTSREGPRAVMSFDFVSQRVVRDDLRAYVVDYLGDAVSGVLIVDETGFLKQGTKSCGAARQYIGTAGDTVNAQVGVFLAYASAKGVAFIDRALYLPREWTKDRHRRSEAGIPKGIRFATKIALAQRMLARAFDADTPAHWVVADSGYGRSHGFRQWLEKRGCSYAVMIPKTNALHYRGRRERAEQLGERLTADAWAALSADVSIGGERVHDWACLPLSDCCPVAMCRWLLIRRDPNDPSAHTYWLAYAPVATTVAQLVGVCERRWAIEECFAQAKGELGMDQYEVRKWEAWHRFVTLCLLGHAYLVVLRSAAQQEEAEEKGAQIAA